MPEQKFAPSPFKTYTLTSESFEAKSNAFNNSAHIGISSAFCFVGLFKEIVATSEFTSTFKAWYPDAEAFRIPLFPGWLTSSLRVGEVNDENERIIAGDLRIGFKVVNMI